MVPKLWRFVGVIVGFLGPWQQTTIAFGQQAAQWDGKKVVTRYSAPVMAGERVVDDGSSFRIYTVEQSKGDWLLLRSGVVRGWVPAREVVLYDRAIEYYSQEIRTKRNDARPYVMLGMIRNSKEEFDLAIAAFNAALRIDPGSAAAYGNRGAAWLYKKDFDRAIADLDVAIRLAPNYAFAYYNRGAAWGNKGEFGKAVVDFDETIRLNPKHALAYISRGIIRYSKRSFAKAVADLKEAVRLDPENAQACNNLAWLLATCPEGKYRDGQKAVAIATHACELSGWTDADFLGTLAAAYAEAGDFEKAVEFQEKVNKLNTDAGKKTKGERRVALYREKKPYRDTD